MTQGNARAHVNGSSEARDAQGFAPQLFRFLNFRAGHQILDECIECSAHDHYVGATQRRACRRAAGYLQKLYFARNQGVHSFHAGGCGDDFYSKPCLLKIPASRANHGGIMTAESDVNAMRTLRKPEESAA